ncbi:hypothetical protein LZ32DRAFT_254774 [Colletotrichum eremochloae]|nr:hypothetical protein LZ32DRAFT_254774 [Colletotrichum eremochloae]
MLSCSYWSAAIACVCFACIRRCQARPYNIHEVSKGCQNKVSRVLEALSNMAWGLCCPHC